MPRKKFLIITCILLFCSFFCIFQNPHVYVHAEERIEEEKLEEIINEQLNKLDLESLQAYLDSLSNFSKQNVIERLTAYIKGEGIDFKNIGEEIVSILFKKVTELIPAFSCIAAVSLLTGLISSIKSEAGGKTSSEMIFLIGYIAALLPIITVLIECLQMTKNGITEMQRQMQIIFPPMMTLMAASGGTLSVAVCKPAVAFFATTIVTTIVSIVFPLTVTILAFSMASNLTKELKINKFTAFFKSINKWIIGLCIAVFGLFMTLQGITAAQYDGIARRAAKYAIGNGIPIVGGFLSGGFDLAVAGSVLIKNSLGSLGIFLMISVLFEPIIMLVSVNIMLRLTAAITQPFGESRISDFLEETAGNLQYCTASLLFTSFLYFLMIVIMICSSEVLF